MDLSVLMARLGRKTVAAACGVRQNAVSNWLARGELPAEHRLTVWQMALDAGLDWTPPGAEALRDKLRAADPGAPRAA
jgi:hypothetical protein